MNKTLKKTLSVILTILMIVTTMPMAFAADVVDSGTCGADGDNLTWELDADGTLTISGTGAMADGTPWKSNAISVKKVVIENGVTSIGSSAFAWCQALSDITIPDSVTSIGSHAFSWCHSLKTLTIPDSVTDIAAYAFAESGIVSIEFPDSITSINDNMFYWCTALRNVTIPESVTSIGNSAFYFCVNLESIEIPASVTSIGTDAFTQCQKLTAVTVPCTWDGTLYTFDSAVTVNKVHRYTNGACTNCGYECPHEVYTNGICDNCKYECPHESYTDGECTACGFVCSHSYTNHYCKTCGNTENGYYAGTCGAESINDVIWSLDAEGALTISGKGKMADFTSVTTVPWYAHRASIKTLIIEDGVTSIGNYAFYNHTNLESARIPDSVTSIGNYAFMRCYNLKSARIPDSVTSIGNNAFYACSALEEIHIPYGITTLDVRVFEKCTSVTKIIVPNSVTKLNQSAFFECSALTEITIPDSVTSIDIEAFGRCGNLEVVHYLGTSESWNNIKIEELNNSDLFNAAKHFCIKDADGPICPESEYTESWYCPDCKTYVSGHDGSNNDGICARENCDYVCTHNVKYFSNENTITAFCADLCGLELGSATINVQSKLYDTKAPEVTITKTGIMQEQDILIYYSDKESISNDPPFTVGEYTATIKCDDVVATTYFTIDKSNYIYTAPVANTLTYTGTTQNLVTEGTVEYGEMEYSLDGMVYSADVPVGKEVGDYTVYYRILGYGNCYDVSGVVPVTIKECYHERTANGKCENCDNRVRRITIVMNDNSDDYWDYAFINILQLIDGEFKYIDHTSFENAENHIYSTLLSPDSIYALEWEQGHCPYECSFTIEVDNEIVYEISDGSKIEDYKVFYVICEHSFENGICSECGLTCGVDLEHDWSNGDDICAVCGESCPHENYTDGTCNVCGYECLHESYTDGKCDVCGYECLHEGYTNGVCEKCGVVCKHTGGTATCIDEAVCSVCGKPYGKLLAHIDENSDHFCDYGCGYEILGDGIPLTIDLSGSSEYFDCGDGYDYFDEDGYIISGRNSNANVAFMSSTRATLKDMTANIIDVFGSPKENPTIIRLDGDNYVESKWGAPAVTIGRNSHLIIEGGANDTLTFLNNSTAFIAQQGALTINGGKIIADKSYSSITTSDGFTLNGGEVTVSAISGKTNLNGGKLTINCTNGIAISGDLEIAKGALLIVSATSKLIGGSYNITIANEAEENLSIFVKFDADSGFVPVYDIKAALEGKTYAEIKVGTHKHVFDDSSKCACGYVCTHDNITNKICDDCGAEGVTTANKITIKMSDDYGDGWYGTSVVIESFDDGSFKELARATVEDGYDGTFTIALPVEGAYAFRWLILDRDVYDCSFTIEINGNIVYTATKGKDIDGRNIEDGELLYLLCEHYLNTNTEYTPDDNGTTHSLNCSVCSVALDSGTHSGGTATCVSGKICELCKGEYGEVDADNHKDTLVPVDAKAKTCTTVGWNAYEYCSECEYTTYVEIPASHEIKTVDKKDATCTEAGHEAYEYCTECDYTTYAEIPAGHTPLPAVKENEVEPECEKVGSYDLVVYCDVCGEDLDRDTVAVDALTHKDEDGDYLCDHGCGHEFEKPVDPTPDEPDTPDEPADDTCDHICHKDGILGFFWKIISFLQRLFGIQQYCDCGELHYNAPIFG